MKITFVDTSAWFAIQDKSDANHEIASLFVKKSIAGKYQLLTTNYILDETYTLLLERIGYKFVIQFKNTIDIMLSSRMLIVTRISESVEEWAWNIFEQFNIDKKWSFTDCTSKVIIEQKSIQEVFAFDHHFEQMGFIRKP
jgi:predicted nucleic acid-binding protein